MSEPNIRKIAAKLTTQSYEDCTAGIASAGLRALAADWLRLTAPLGDENLAEIQAVRLKHGERHAPILLAPWEIDALLQEIRRLTASRCRCFYGGYQPVPIRCALDVHTGQHAGISDNGETVIWPENGELRLAATEARLIHAEEEVETLKTRVEQQGREIAGLRNTLDHIASSEDTGLAYARRIARRALTHVTCPDCDGTGVLNAGPGGHDHCDRCGTTGRIRIVEPANLP